MDGSGMPLLSLLIWMPIIGGVAVLLAGDQRAGLARWLSLAVSLATLFMSFSLFTGFDRSTSAMQFEEMRPWIEIFSIHYHLGVDGFAVPLILLTTFFGPLVVIAPAARWWTKQWPAEWFGLTADRLVGSHGARLAVIGAPGESDRTATVVGALSETSRGPAADLGGRTSLRGLAALLRRADLLLACDSGPVHLADALGTATAAPLLRRQEKQFSASATTRSERTCRLYIVHDMATRHVHVNFSYPRSLPTSSARFPNTCVWPFRSM